MHNVRAVTLVLLRRVRATRRRCSSWDCAWSITPLCRPLVLLDFLLHILLLLFHLPL